jgi:hypothetical protein
VDYCPVLIDPLPIGRNGLRRPIEGGGGITTPKSVNDTNTGSVNMPPSKWIVLRLASVTRRAWVVWSVSEFVSVTVEDELPVHEYSRNARTKKIAIMITPDNIVFFLRKSIRN